MAQPQTQELANSEELYGLNSKWVEGVGPGYWPTAGSGLTLNLAAGTSFARNVRASYAGGTLSLTNNATNYVFLDTTAACAPSFNTSGYPTSGIPLATVVTASGAITSITDDRTWFVGGFATATLAGIVPTPPNDATKYLDGTANWSVPPNTAIIFVDCETVTASGTSATLAHTPNPSGSLILVVDGAVLTVGAGNDFTLSSATITFATAPRAGANIRAWYRY